MRVTQGVVTTLGYDTATIIFAATDGSGIVARTDVILDEPVRIESLTLAQDMLEGTVGDRFPLPELIIYPLCD